MKCIFCGHEESKVLDSRASENSIRRRRECLNCGRRFTTYETIDAVPFLIVQRDGSRQSYNSEKLKKSLEFAFLKRPYNSEEIDKIILAIEKNIQNRFIQEITSTEFSDIVLNIIKKTDEVAYIRYASIVKDFKTADDFRFFIDNM